MAAITHYMTKKGVGTRVDGLCPKCFNPALKTAIGYRIDLDGITELGDRVLCSDCKIWVSPLRKLNS